MEKFKENHKPLEAKSDYDDTNSFKQLKKRRNDDSNLNLEQKKGQNVPVKVSIPKIKIDFRIICYLSSDATVDIQPEWH